MINHYLIVDLETTNRNIFKAEIITGSFILVDDKMDIVTIYNIQCNPRLWDKEADDASLIHGISKADASGFDDYSTTIKELAGWLETLPPCHFVAHANRQNFGTYATYDYAILNMALLDYDLHYTLYKICPSRFIISTHSLAKYLKLPCDLNLEAIAQHLNVSMGTHHNAESDAFTCFEILKKLLPTVDLNKFLDYENFKLTDKDENNEPTKKRKTRKK